MTKVQRILGCVRNAVDTYNMIEDGDKIAVGVSGGKDSVLLLKALCGLKAFYPVDFEIVAITLDMRFNNVDGDFSEIQKICDEEFSNTDNYPAGTKVSLSYELSVETKGGEIVKIQGKTHRNAPFFADDHVGLLLFKNVAAQIDLRRDAGERYVERIKVHFRIYHGGEC